jgi:hypothetical protein
MFGSTFTIEIIDGGLLLESTNQAMDTCSTVGYRGPLQPKPAAYFDGCLSLTDATAIHDCLLAYSDGC